MTSISSAEVADFAPARTPLRPRSRARIAFAIAALLCRRAAGRQRLLAERNPYSVSDPVACRTRTEPLDGICRPGLAWYRRLHVGGRLCDLQSAAAAAGTSVACQPDTRRRRRRSGGSGRRPAQPSHQGTSISSPRPLRRSSFSSGSSTSSAGSRTIRRPARYPLRVLPFLVTIFPAPSAAISSLYRRSRS